MPIFSYNLSVSGGLSPPEPIPGLRPWNPRWAADAPDPLSEPPIFRYRVTPVHAYPLVPFPLGHLLSFPYLRASVSTIQQSYSNRTTVPNLLQSCSLTSPYSVAFPTKMMKKMHFVHFNQRFGISTPIVDDRNGNKVKPNAKIQTADGRPKIRRGPNERTSEHERQIDVVDTAAVVEGTKMAGSGDVEEGVARPEETADDDVGAAALVL